MLKTASGCRILSLALQVKIASKEYCTEFINRLQAFPFPQVVSRTSVLSTQRRSCIQSRCGGKGCGTSAVGMCIGHLIRAKGVDVFEMLAELLWRILE